MGLLVFIGLGLIIGVITRALLPPPASLGFGGSMASGVVGALIGATVSSLMTGSPMTDVHTAGCIGSILGALLVLTAADDFFAERAM